jgi:hypothetical protein
MPDDRHIVSQDIIYRKRPLHVLQIFFTMAVSGAPDRKSMPIRTILSSRELNVLSSISQGDLRAQGGEA